MTPQRQSQLRRAYLRALRAYKRTASPADRLRLTRAFLAVMRAGGRATVELWQERILEA